MSKNMTLAVVLCLTQLTSHAQHKQQTSGRFITIDAPGAASTAQANAYPLHGTQIVDINASGEVVGTFNDDANTVLQTFIRYPNGHVVVSDDPNAGISAGPFGSQVGTNAFSINDRGEVTGGTTDQSGQSVGFLRSVRGSFTDYKGPSTTGYAASTRSFSINAKGQTTGDYLDPIGSHGYIRQPDGSFIPVDAPDASFSGFWNGTTSTSINRAGDVCGYYHDANAIIHSFLRRQDGTYIDFDVPGTGTNPYQGALCLRITDAGDVLGFYVDQNFQTFGYVRFKNGQVWTVTFPQIPDTHNLVIVNINHRGDVLATYTDSNAVAHSFVLSRSGRLIKIDAPLAGSGVNQGTFAANFNDSDQVAGYYFDENNISHGFLWDAHRDE